MKNFASYLDSYSLIPYYREGYKIQENDMPTKDSYNMHIAYVAESRSLGAIESATPFAE